MPLHPQALKFLQIVNAMDSVPMHQLGATKAREAYAERDSSLSLPWVSVFKVENQIIEHKHFRVPIRVYTPKTSPTPLPVFLFYHGGGMVIGSVEGYDTLCRQICALSECIVISVDYRLAPEHKFPAAVDDAYAAFLWVKNNADSFNGDSSLIAVGGDSAGGNLAAVVTLLAKKESLSIICQALIYPATAPHADSPSHMNFATGYFLERETVLWFHNCYLRSEKDRENFRYAPLIADSLNDLPPALIILAAYDTLRDEGLAYAERLQASGVRVTLKEYDGMFHPFVSLAGVLDDGKEAITLLANYLRTNLSLEKQHTP